MCFIVLHVCIFVIYCIKVFWIRFLFNCKYVNININKLKNLHIIVTCRVTFFSHRSCLMENHSHSFVHSLSLTCCCFFFLTLILDFISVCLQPLQSCVCYKLIRSAPVSVSVSWQAQSLPESLLAAFTVTKSPAFTHLFSLNRF